MIFMFAAGWWAKAQSSSTTFTCRPNGSAVVVSNMDNAVRWYQSVFDLKIKSRIDDPNNAYKVVILESSQLMFELLELKGSIARKDVLAAKGDGIQVQGHFKIGFIVNDIDAVLRHLQTLAIAVPRVWTDPSTKKRNFLIQDPDGNYIQFFD
jgi:predicted enzyme related to lactoylglutathione lyase